MRLLLFTQAISSLALLHTHLTAAQVSMEYWTLEPGNIVCEHQDSAGSSYTLPCGDGSDEDQWNGCIFNPIARQLYCCTTRTESPNYCWQWYQPCTGAPDGRNAGNGGVDVAAEDQILCSLTTSTWCCRRWHETCVKNGLINLCVPAGMESPLKEDRDDVEEYRAFPKSDIIVAQISGFPQTSTGTSTSISATSSSAVSTATSLSESASGTAIQSASWTSESATSTPTTTEPLPVDGDEDGLETGVIAGISIGAAVVVAMIAFGVFFWKRRKERSGRLPTSDGAHVPSMADGPSMAELEGRGYVSPSELDGSKDVEYNTNSMYSSSNVGGQAGFNHPPVELASPTEGKAPVYHEQYRS